MLKTHIISLGCPKNTVDTERLLASLNFEIQSVSSPIESDIVFINTCSFVNTAVEESIETILEVIESVSSLEHKPYIIVAGCLVGRYGEEDLRKDLPEVDLWLSNKSISTWGLSILSLLNVKSSKAKQSRIVSTQSYSWLKIAEGCSHSCSFCTIPSIRGPYRSFVKDELLNEANELVGKGIKELIVVAQDITKWGGDFTKSRETLSTLLQDIGAISGLHWLRLLYLYPAGVTTELLETLTTIPTFVPYFDIPMQHVHPEIVEKMGRPFAHNPWKIIERVRSFFPHAALRTSIIVGFPGETEEHFSFLLSFVKEAQFAHLGVFTYQPENGTPSATYPNQIPEEVKEERKARLLEVQMEQSKSYLTSFVGSKMDILIDSKSDEWDGLYHGRAWFQAPEFDGITYISGDFSSKSPIGSMEQATITESLLYDIVAVV
ncbi:MAG: 30S ribosomal protein S12 methylthiotransferase RimO [Desulfovibrionaceae bacterium]|nr:30S ribosomal protein S12 methylthiotransferase RimO [Desulfovibrionaceae bacterium]